MKLEYNPVAQEELMGCGVACVASLLGISYKEALRLFGREKVTEPDFYCKDVVEVLKKVNLSYQYSKKIESTKKYLNILGSIVFLKRSKRYPHGHYLLKTDKGWMNSWINYPEIAPAKSGFNKKLPGIAQWIIYPKE